MAALSYGPNKIDMLAFITHLPLLALCLKYFLSDTEVNLRQTYLIPLSFIVLYGILRVETTFSFVMSLFLIEGVKFITLIDFKTDKKYIREQLMNSLMIVLLGFILLILNSANYISNREVWISLVFIILLLSSAHIILRNCINIKNRDKYDYKNLNVLILILYFNPILFLKYLNTSSEISFDITPVALIFCCIFLIVGVIYNVIFSNKESLLIRFAGINVFNIVIGYFYMKPDLLEACMVLLFNLLILLTLYGTKSIVFRKINLSELILLSAPFSPILIYNIRNIYISRPGLGDLELICLISMIAAGMLVIPVLDLLRVDDKV